jgi:hypothetical protein
MRATAWPTVPKPSSATRETPAVLDVIFLNLEKLKVESRKSKKEGHGPVQSFRLLSFEFRLRFCV